MSTQSLCLDVKVTIWMQLVHVWVSSPFNHGWVLLGGGDCLLLDTKIVIAMQIWMSSCLDVKTIIWMQLEAVLKAFIWGLFRTSLK